MIEHSEHRMMLRREPAAVAADPLVTIRAAELADGPFVVSCLAKAFDFPADLEAGELETLAKRFPGTLVIDYANQPVGTVRVDRDADAAGIYGFAICRSSKVAASDGRCFRTSPGMSTQKAWPRSGSRCRSPTTALCTST